MVFGLVAPHRKWCGAFAAKPSMEKQKRAKGGGRKKKFGEESKNLSFRVPASKEQEFKDHVKPKLEEWSIPVTQKEKP